jgi:TRAP-type C4-dicarboxylate transport system substrate-binding protein
MQSTIRKSIAEFNKSITSTYKFPPEAKAIIESLVKEAVQTYFKAEVTRWEKAVNEFFAAKQAESDRLTEAKVFEAIEKMRPAIKQQAREEFIATLEAVKGKA